MVGQIFKKVSGLLLVFVVLYVGTAMLSYHASDVSFNAANSSMVVNFCGKYGAYAADFFWQGLGIVSFPLLFAVFVFGSVCFLGKEISYLSLRVFVCIISLILFFLAAYYGDVGRVGILPNLCAFIGLPLPSPSVNANWLAVGFFLFSILFFIYAISLSFCVYAWNKLKIVIGFIAVLFRRKGTDDKDSYDEEDDTDEAAGVSDIADVIEGKDVKKENASVIVEKKIKETKKIKDKVLTSNAGYRAPSLELLATPKNVPGGGVSKDAMLEMGRNLQEALKEYSIDGEIGNFKSGPVVTLFEFKPAKGIKFSRVQSLSMDIARAMSVPNIRVSIIEGTSLIGIEIPNKIRQTVFLKELLETEEFKKSKGKLCLALGKDIMGQAVYANLEKMPHLLVAGTTGSGKSVAVNTIIMSLLYRLGPDECKLIMVDPKMLELSIYNDIPHLLSPVITDPPKAVAALKWAVKEMNSRYMRIGKLNVRNLEAYNEKVAEMQANHQTWSRTVQSGFDDEGKAVYETVEEELKKMPYIVIIVDEMADLMLYAKKDINGLIQSLAQKARAAGIHVITATQRPSVDVITGVIKANFPARISFQVTSGTDSRTILNEQGAEHLLGMGDMLYLSPGKRPLRIQCPFVSDKEVENITEYLRSLGPAEYVDDVTDIDAAADGDGQSSSDDADGGAKDVYQQAIEIVRTDRKTSISYLQRRLNIGYNKAATFIERMESEGIISKPNSSGKREIL